MSALRVHRPDGTPVLIDQGPCAAHPMPGHVSGSMIVGQSGTGNGPGRVRPSRAQPHEPKPSVAMSSREKMRRRRERHREAYNAYMREYARRRREAA